MRRMTKSPGPLHVVISKKELLDVLEIAMDSPLPVSADVIDTIQTLSTSLELYEKVTIEFDPELYDGEEEPKPSQSTGASNVRAVPGSRGRPN